MRCLRQESRRAVRIKCSNMKCITDADHVDELGNRKCVHNIDQGWLFVRLTHVACPQELSGRGGSMSQNGQIGIDIVSQAGQKAS